MPEHLISTIAYSCAAVVMLIAGMTWTRRWLRHRHGKAEKPAEVSPVNSFTLGYAAAVGVGALIVSLAGYRHAPWGELAFGCLQFGLAIRCGQYLTRWRSPAATSFAVITAITLGGIIAAPL